MKVKLSNDSTREVNVRNVFYEDSNSISENSTVQANKPTVIKLEAEVEDLSCSSDEPSSKHEIKNKPKPTVESIRNILI